MNDPLKIMDEIYRDGPHPVLVTISKKEWQSLHTAIEAQQARLARLEECIRTLTYSNYRDGRRFIGFPQNSDVTGVTEVLNETDHQSLAAVKAEGIRELAREHGPYAYLMGEADRIEREGKDES